MSSVHEAVLLLGVDRLRDWATLMLVSDLDDPGSQQLSGAVTRARMCQNIAERMDMPAEPAFTVGLVSAVAELLGQPAAELAMRLSLSHEVTAALVAGTGPLGELFAVSAYEASDIEALIDAPLDDDEAAVSYLDAIAGLAQQSLQRGQQYDQRGHKATPPRIATPITTTGAASADRRGTARRSRS